MAALTLGLPSTDHWVKTLGGLAPYFRGQAHVFANEYGQPQMWPARCQGRSLISGTQHLTTECPECTTNLAHSLRAILLHHQMGVCLPSSHSAVTACSMIQEYPRSSTTCTFLRSGTGVAPETHALHLVPVVVAHGSHAPSAVVTCLLLALSNSYLESHRGN